MFNARYVKVPCDVMPVEWGIGLLRIRQSNNRVTPPSRNHLRMSNVHMPSIGKIDAEWYERLSLE
jgi:hypothetical protein